MRDTASLITRGTSCAKARAVLDGIQTPLGLLDDGGTPITWADELRAAGKRLGALGSITPAPVGTFEAGLSSDLDRLTAALDAKENGAVAPTADVIHNRIKNLTYQCQAR
ncbi:hypothetical protein [Streptomyces sp. NBC_01190]|uniref:hypothetical protein n=1 Tax=Streptomyces sp. NBC_01190 TaxID=2903767 RepID=UPI003864D895|nr:hypothetical protein OG519_07355 [Streptomyces sp. NBC_01190]